MINDLAVNPRSGNVYLAVSRGRGPDAVPLLVRVKSDGKIEEVSLEEFAFSKVEIPNAPSATAKATPRAEPAQPVDHRPGLFATAAYSSRACRTKSFPRD